MNGEAGPRRTDTGAPASTPAKPLGRALRPRNIVIATVAFVIVAIASILLLPGILVDHWLSGITTDSTTIRLSLTNAAQTVLFILGGAVGLVGVALSLSRHGLELEIAAADRAKEERRIGELSQQRQIEAERELRSRFADAVSLLIVISSRFAMYRVL